MADADLASGQPCVPDHGEQGPQSLAQELPRGVSEPLPHCESVWGRGGGRGRGSPRALGRSGRSRSWAPGPLSHTCSGKVLRTGGGGGDHRWPGSARCLPIPPRPPPPLFRCNDS